MRREWAILCFLAGAACPLSAATPMTVAQLQQLLNAFRGKSDGKVARRLSEIELTERVSAAQFAHWQAEFSGGHTREALTELADASAFLDLPTTEIPSTPAPSFEEQRQILSRAVSYAAKALSKLPNFYATRETTHFEDTLPRETFEPIATTSSGRGGSRSMGTAGMTVTGTDYQPLHKTGTFSEKVRYQDGFEVNGSHGHKSWDEQGTGLTTNGEFGPILFVVLRDSVKGQLVWNHWEQGSNGSVAVFAYSVPQANSHYMVAVPRTRGFDQLLPAYRGEIAIDPANGTILRLTVISEMAPPYQTVKAAILVEYAPVAIGDRTYICPVKGVALSKMPAGGANDGSQVQTRLNEVVFKDYHLFRGDAHILTGAVSGNGTGSAATAAAISASQ
jgi:hypothetical protein